MDPLSFTASLIAVVGLAGEVAKTCKSYIDGIKNHPREIRVIFIELNSLTSVLEGLKILREDDFEDAQIIRQLRGQNGPIQGCQETIRNLHGLLKLNSTSGTAAPGGSRSRRKRLQARLPTLDELAWPFRKDEAVALLKAIATHKQTIGAALTASVLSEVQSMKAKLNRAEQDRLHAWLVQINPSSNHNTANSLYEKKTGDWIFRSQEWKLWVNKQSKERSLWIHGIPGAGKTILASHIIEQLIKTKCSGSVALVYYYCYHGHNRDETFSFLRWLISQLCRKTDTVSSLTYDIYRSGQDPDITKLLSALLTQLDSLDTVYVAVDALDESQQPRDRFLDVLRKLATDQRFQKIQLLTTSREYADIERVMAPISLSVLTSHEEVEKDIRVFVEGSISRSDSFKHWPDDLKLEVIDALAKGAKGMFRWAVCQLDILRRLNCATHEDVRETIKTLPKDLDETYTRILNLIHSDDLELVRFTIHWLIYTENLINYDERLLDVTEVLSAYALHSSGSSERANQISIRCNLDRLKDCCGCLVSFSQDSYRKALRCNLSHYTIKEFLTSDRFKPSDQLKCLHLATMKTYLPNVILRMNVEGHGCAAEGYISIHSYEGLARQVVSAEEFLDYQLAFRFFLINVAPDTDTYYLASDSLPLVMSTIYDGIEWVGDRPSDEIIVLLRLLVVSAFHLSRSLLETVGSHLLCSSLDLIWYDYHLYGNKQPFKGNIVEFLATIFFTSPATLLFLLENYYDDFAQSVDLSGILQSFQTGRRESLDWLRKFFPSIWSNFDKEEEVAAKVVQKLQNMGAVSINEDPESDLEPNAESTTEPTVEAGMESHDRSKRWLDVVLRNERKEEIES
ncbi:hypothetical protein NEUTE1DRAFT_117897 [Neurospora tetrasperma FGSC 2508]|uniref:NACHT domain-containing protein n=1 Tax=Neurospora tetrasperma (strain FGSC 2508 / ATCC MYA-4615 / P0657) TaxID=510951 RepID=F8MRS9_NEUT8|nr:uncharacterized protein NEUTE1DRAFT_117897 [Neurospora tetrasperma FGSC 2508]EGO55775.1 hypothetical protein NEUTE1DRAFT_117897 [Neurospora tetrasperma FGSC 2508]EGZ68972.1 hypothetical protein NEUTE2DRAFT_145395 [Neurospora tetrasperma FGSC 2509]